MAKDYGKKRTVPQRRQGPRHFIVMLVSFLSGYLSATFFDFASLTHWMNTHFVKSPTANPAKISMKEPSVPKPKFEFYTLLSKDTNPSVMAREKPASASAIQAVPANPIHASVSVPAAMASGQHELATNAKKNLPSSNDPKENYIIQIAAFNKRQDAEHLKASLVLRGFDVNIMPILKQNMTWFRVTIGPFSTRKDAENAQYIVSRSERMVGMIRKI